MIERVRFEIYQNTQFLIEDFSESSRDELLQTAAASRQVIQSQPPHSVRILVLAYRPHIDVDTVRALKDTAAENAPFALATAVVGLDSFMKMLLKGVEVVSGRNFTPFDSEELARKWLAEQKQ